MIDQWYIACISNAHSLVQGKYPIMKINKANTKEIHPSPPPLVWLAIFAAIDRVYLVQGCRGYKCHLVQK